MSGRQIHRYFYSKTGDEGVTAVEFSLIALPFFIMLIGIVKTAMFYTAGSVLQGASADAARLIRTGQVQESADPEQTFKNELCDKAGALLDCANIQYEVIAMPADTFADAENYQPQFDSEGNLVPSGFSAGNSEDVVLVRAYYKYEFLTPFLGEMMTGSSSKNWIGHIATVVIRSEPYHFGEM